MTQPQSPLFGVSEFTTWPWSFEQDVEEYSRLGIDAIEVCEAKLDPERAAGQIAAAMGAGLTVSSVQPRLHSLFPDEPRPEPKEPAERMRRYRKTIEFFGKHCPGVTLVTITGAVPGWDFNHGYDVAVREYTLLADYAADHGVRIALEPLNPILMNIDSFICTVPEALDIIHAVNRPNFGIFLDVWHIWANSAAVDWIERCEGIIFGVHINDWRRPRHTADREVIGRGQIDLPPLLRAIRRSGYDGAYTLELFSSDWLPDSLWKGDMHNVISESRSGFESAWQASFSL